MQEREELNKLYKAPGNRRLTYIAMAVIAAVIIILLSMILWIGRISPESMPIMRGCAGLGAIIFVVLVGVVSYRVNNQHLDNRRRH